MSRSIQCVEQALVMKFSCWFIATILLVGISQAYAADELPSQQEFYPANGKGRVVVVVTGQTGPLSYAYYAKDIAAQGYYAVLADGNDFWGTGLSRNNVGLDRLKGVLARAQRSPHALPGKVAVIGFSLGGASCLTYAARMPDSVFAVVTYYPDTRFIVNPGDFASKIRVPTLMLAGVLDRYKDCCVIERARELAAAAKAGGGRPMLTLVEYPSAGHGFAIKRFEGWRSDDAADAFRRTLEYLKRNSG
jgi:pimeloyl-ACP methyl ester carboxylesterase